MNRGVTDNSSRGFAIATGAILLSLALRIAGARGDLWMDELWSLELLRQVTSPDQIVWKINHANNHYLNSVWMYALGRHASPLLYRAPAVALGTCGVAAAGLWARARGRVAALTAMLLFAVSYIFVDFGSEARGYAGLVLGMLLSFHWLEQALAGGGRGWRLGFAMLFGFLSQILMLVAIAAMVAWALWAEMRRTGDMVASLRTALRIFLVPALLILPFFGTLVWSVATHRFVAGPHYAFDALRYLGGYGRMIEATSPLPGLETPLLYAALAALSAVAWFLLRRRDDPRVMLYLLCLLLIPLVMMSARMPVATMSRYFVLSGVALLLLFADAAAFGWGRRGAWRAAVLAALLVFVAGNGLLLAKFLRDGRGHYSQAMAAMAVSGPALYGGMEGEQRSAVMEDYFIEALNAPLRFVPRDKWCATPPRFLLLYNQERNPVTPVVTTGPAQCALRFDSPRIFPSWGLDGMEWIVYRRDGE